MPQTFKIYGLIDPRSHELYYIGQTRRALHDRMDEHFFESGETQVSKKNRAIIQSGQLPQIILLERGIESADGAHEAELEWIYKFMRKGAPLKNREAQAWFRSRYHDSFGPAGGGQSTVKAKRAKANHKAQAIPGLKSGTYAEVKALAPGANVEQLEKSWREWCKNKGLIPTSPDKHFLRFCETAVGRETS